MRQRHGDAYRSRARAGWFDDGVLHVLRGHRPVLAVALTRLVDPYVPTAVLRHLHSATSTEWSPLWVFHVDRNRLLMLTKNASGSLAARAIWGYLRGSAGSFERTVRDAVVQRRRPALRSDALRAHILLALPAPCTATRCANAEQSATQAIAEQVGAAEAGWWLAGEGCHLRPLLAFDGRR